MIARRERREHSYLVSIGRYVMRTFWLGLAITGFAASQSIAGPINVTTYHYDNFRTGWNQIEPGLKPSNVRGAGFGLLHSTRLDDQVDAQPLILGSQKVAGHSAREVAYV